MLLFKGAQSGMKGKDPETMTDERQRRHGDIRSVGPWKGKESLKNWEICIKPVVI